jgi:hypothetical protein
MIIRSYSRRTRSFLQLVSYLTRDGRLADRPPLTFNLFAPGIPDPDAPPAAPAALDPACREVAAEFLKNSRHLRPRKNGVVLYHEILSFAKADRARATPEMLTELACHYLEQRAPGALAFGVVHTDRENLHIHLMISANLRDRPDKLRLSRAEFARIKRELEQLQRTLYPALVHSRVSHGPGPEQRRQQRGQQQEQEEEQRAPRPAHAERQRQCRLERQGKRAPSRKELLYERALAALIAAAAPADLPDRLRERGLGLYERGGRPEGIIADGRKYRFTTLGLGPALTAARERWQRYPDNRRRIGEVYAEKLRRTFRRDNGFHLDIADVLRPAGVLLIPSPFPADRMPDRMREGGGADGEAPAAAQTGTPAPPPPESRAAPSAPPSAVRLAALWEIITRKRRRAREAPAGRDRDRDRDWDRDRDRDFSGGP